MTPVTSGTPVSPEGSDNPRADGSAPQDVRGAEPRLPSRAFVRGMAWSALVALWLLCGCGGDVAFTGGSIPPGGTRLVGRVAAAENPLVPLAGAIIQVTSRPITGGVRTATATTAVDGTFLFSSVPTGSTTSSMTVTVTPAPSQGRQPQTVAFQATNDVTDDLVVSLPLNTFDIELPASLTLESVDTVLPGNTATIHALLFDSLGNRVSAEPTLLYTGNYGSITVGDIFSATEPGSKGSITAFWYGLASVTTRVTVITPDPNNPPPPPGPPAVPDLPPTPGTVSASSVRSKH